MEVIYTENVEPTSLRVELSLGRALAEGEMRALDDLLTAWYQVAVHGGFGGSVHNMTETEWVGSDRAAWRIDYGSADQRALEALIAVLAEFTSVRDITGPRLKVGDD